MSQDAKLVLVLAAMHLVALVAAFGLLALVLWNDRGDGGQAGPGSGGEGGPEPPPRPMPPPPLRDAAPARVMLPRDRALTASGRSPPPARPSTSRSAR